MPNEKSQELRQYAKKTKYIFEIRETAAIARFGNPIKAISKVTFAVSCSAFKRKNSATNAEEAAADR